MTDFLVNRPRADFLLALDDATRPLVEAAEITQAVATLLGQYLHVDRCTYAEIESEQSTFEQLGSDCLRLLSTGQPYVVGDSEIDPRTIGVRESYRAAAVRAGIWIPMLKRGRLVAVLAVHEAAPRIWRADEIELVQMVASRCWESIERARLTRDQLRRSELQFAQLINGVTDCAIYMLDPSGYVTTWNPGAARIKGYSAEEIIGRHFSEFYTADDREAGLPAHALEVARAQGKFEREGWRVRKDGTRFWASVLIDPIYGPDNGLTGYAKITRDMTERLAIQEQLNQSQKVEAIGQLTGGVAHDFNNLLTVILGNLDTISRQLPADNAKLTRAVEHAMRGAERAAALTHQLLAFSRRQPLNPKPTDVNQLVIGLMELIRRTLPAAIAVKSRLTSGLKRANVDSNQLESALLNLAVNARDAMAEGGNLMIETGAERVDEAFASKLAGDIVPGDYVVISVRDTGAGMTSEVRARAFDPFFTTKPLGKGTGLGLSQVFGFVKQSGGHVQLESEPGRGTTVKIYLPCTSGENAQSTKSGEPEMPHGESNETVLVVEDQDDVRLYSTDSLRDLGFSVLSASDGPAALRIIEEHPEIRLLFTDVGLPQMSGRELAEAAWKIRPQLPVLFVTGYAHDNLFQQGRLDPAAELLTKPFNRAQLASRVRRMLDTAVRH
jgi:PAS domain S-box-containing protein